MKQIESIVLFYLAIQSIILYAQNDFKIKDIGTHYVQFFARNEYQGHNRGLGITQDDQGAIYAANNSCISQFDEKHWKDLSVGIAYEMTSGSDKRIYVDGYRDISILIKDPSGNTGHGVFKMEQEGQLIQWFNEKCINLRYILMVFYRTRYGYLHANKMLNVIKRLSRA